MVNMHISEKVVTRAVAEMRDRGHNRHGLKRGGPTYNTDNDTRLMHCGTFTLKNKLLFVTNAQVAYVQIVNVMSLQCYSNCYKPE